MKIGIYQSKPGFGEKDDNLQKIKKVVSNSQCELVVLPELFSTGYSFLNKEELALYAEPVPDGPTTEYLCTIAKTNKCHIMGGIAEQDGDALYNTAVLVGSDGYKGKYRKLHLFYKEKLIFTPGNLPLTVFDINGVKTGIIICFDWIFPEVWRTLALKGAQIILHPSNLVTYWAQTATIIRSVENRVFTVLANRIGIESRSGEKIKFTGKSQIVSPKGEILVQFSKNKEEFLSIDIDPSSADDKNYTPYNHVLNDRRPEYYHL